jgi:hypothetical protein
MYFSMFRSKSDAEYEASLQSSASFLIAKRPKMEIKYVPSYAA